MIAKEAAESRVFGVKSGCGFGEIDHRRGRPVEVSEASGAEGENGLTGAGGVGNEAGDVDALAGWGKPLEKTNGGLELGDGAAKVAALQVIEPNADEQNPLVKVAHLVSLGAPEQLERFVLLEVLTAIELLDSRPK
jgi:hypothetical protein